MNSNASLDCAFFQLSPRRTRCDLFVSADGKVEKLASGSLKPFLAHLKIVEEQASQDSHLINLEVGRRKNAPMWFNKGTVERFVKFVSTPEVLDLVNILDAEMTQLEGARKMYSQGERDQLSGGSEIKSTEAADATKKELLRAIDVRLAAVKQDLGTAFARASAACFNLESVPELLLFANQFGATHLGEACKNFLSLSQRRTDLFNPQQPLPSLAYHPQWKNISNANVRSSTGSDMSIDEPEVDQTDPNRSAAFQCIIDSLNPCFQQPSTGEPKATTIEHLKPDSQKAVEKVMVKANDPNPVVYSAKAAQHTGGSKRLTVQDRINLFESKQKEQSASPNGVGGSLGGHIANRLAAAKGEHRKNSSDASIEKLVLRRWSSASDMSIELSSNSASSIDQKESGSTAGTPSSANSQIQSVGRSYQNDESVTEALKSNAWFSYKNSMVENSSAFSLSHVNDRPFSKGEIQASVEVHKEDFILASIGQAGLAKENEKSNTLTLKSCSMVSLEHIGMSDQLVSQWRANDFPSKPATFQNNLKAASVGFADDQLMTQFPSRAHVALGMTSELNDKPSHVAPSNDRIEVYDITDSTQNNATQFSACTGKMENVGRSLSGSDSQIQFRSLMGKKEDISSKCDSGYLEINNGSLFQEQEVKPMNTPLSQLPLKSYSAKARQGSTAEGLRFPKKTSETDIAKKYQGSENEILCTEESSAQPSQSRISSEGMDAPFLQKFHIERSNKCNQELNGALHMKADELEKLFAEHKLKTHGDLTISSQGTQITPFYVTKSSAKGFADSSPRKKHENSLKRLDTSSGVEFHSVLPRMIENIELCDISMQKINSPIDYSRGKLYVKYMQKRDTKLNEECKSIQAEKKAKMKVIHDCLERSQEEMKTKLSSFSNNQRLTDARRQTEKTRSFNIRSTPKVKEQTFEPLVGYGGDDNQASAQLSTGNQSKKPLSLKSLSSTTLASASPALEHSMKSANSNSLKHREHTENYVAQSVPKLSDMKNENIKPSLVINKGTTRKKPKGFARSKSSVEDAEASKEDRSCWSNTVRKNAAKPSELMDHNIQISGEFEQCLRKGNGVKKGSASIKGNLRSITSTTEESKIKEKQEDIVQQREDSIDMDMDDDEFERPFVEANNLIMDLAVAFDDEKARQSQESVEPESEYGGLMKPQSHRNDSRLAFSKYNPAGQDDDSAEGSYGSFNSHVYHSVDFHTDCTSWNSQSLSRIIDSEAADMRGNGGNGRNDLIPVVAVSTSQQSRRDVAKGFKRLLKFGRKSRGADYLVNDCVSASTASEGDDDPEDGRDLVHRPSDDLRKSRMGCSITSYDVFNDGNIFPEQAPRSFFSLSSFRSKAGDSNKPR